MARTRPTTMDRQAFPSIILSVSIVCFFAVALYERDKVPRTIARDRDAKKSATAGEVAGRSPRSTGPVAPGRSKVDARGGGAVPGLARTPSPSAGRTERTASAPQPGAAPSAAIRKVSKHTAALPPARTPSRGGAAASDGKLARAPFTVVGTGETVADVSRRVYGTTQEAGALWRANRDILPGPDSPVAPGTVLRTPAAPMR